MVDDTRVITGEEVLVLPSDEGDGEEKWVYVTVEGVRDVEVPFGLKTSTDGQFLTVFGANGQTWDPICELLVSEWNTLIDNVAHSIEEARLKNPPSSVS